ncbi:unnamed protein product [Owenia fusiformis]|uniref:B30.2/SPRY domain-containing protein n=1 Tax=Owenia fusiformis TaxID=6347 RepID=A0A8S4PLY4_OWEFU|nr:unnamed protein product [Owenia fusiformis]
MESDTNETSNSENVPDNCHCGKAREIGKIELQCGICLRWFHLECLENISGKLVPFMTTYVLCCKVCSPNGLETFTKKQASFSQMCHTAVANLAHERPTEKQFSKDKDVIPYIDKYWEHLTTMPRRTKLTWHSTIAKIMSKDVDIFKCEERENGEMYFSLICEDLSKIAPNYEVLRTGTASIKAQEGKQAASLSDSKGRGTKRKQVGDTTSAPSTRSKKGDAAIHVAPTSYPTEHPYNKDGYRYILAEPDHHAPNRQAFDESVEAAGKPIPGYLYRIYLEQSVMLAVHDRAPQLKISDDRLSVVGEKGYSMVRATHGVTHGSYYFEVTIKDMAPETAVRLGWAQALGNLQAPCGYDKFSYSWRSKKGTRFHESRGKHYCEGGFGQGDTLGFFIHLPIHKPLPEMLPNTYKDMPLVKFKSHLYYEEKDYVSETEKNLKPLPGSKIIFYKNGKNQGAAWTDIHMGTYYPAISLYKNANVVCNFGPTFKYPPDDIDYRPMQELVTEAVVEQMMADMMYHLDHEGKQPDFL